MLVELDEVIQVLKDLEGNAVRTLAGHLKLDARYSTTYGDGRIAAYRRARSLLEHKFRVTDPRDEEIAEALSDFVRVMFSKLNANRHKGSWRSYTAARVMQMLDIEVMELKLELQYGPSYGSLERACKEAADVANFAMFLSDILHQEMKHTREVGP